MGWQLAVYLGLTRCFRLAAPAYLRQRLRRGREDPTRWREKLAEPSATRPQGRLVWLHAVGLGEVMALRGLIASMAEQDQDLSFLVTSLARSSGQVMLGNLPPRTQHQFLPLDVPAYVARFLDYWRPDLSVWSEQDLWPAALCLADQCKIPLALVNARMNGAAFDRRRRFRNLLAELYPRFGLVVAQDAETAGHLTSFGARSVRVVGSLKAAAPALTVEAAALDHARAATTGRRVWLAASTHADDEALALSVQAKLFARDERWLLIVVPRDPARHAEILFLAASCGLSSTLRSQGQALSGAVHVADTYGELGLWYRLCPVTLMGGTFGVVEGHNPWEPAVLGSAILHGPRVANFAADYAALDGAGAAMVVSAETLADAVSCDHVKMVARATDLSAGARGSLGHLAQDLLLLMGPR